MHDDPFRAETGYDVDVAPTDGAIIVDGRLVEVRAGDQLPYPIARVIPAASIKAPRYRRHPRG